MKRGGSVLGKKLGKMLNVENMVILALLVLVCVLVVVYIRKQRQDTFGAVQYGQYLAMKKLDEDTGFFSKNLTAIGGKVKSPEKLAEKAKKKIIERICNPNEKTIIKTLDTYGLINKKLLKKRKHEDKFMDLLEDHDLPNFTRNCNKRCEGNRANYGNGYPDGYPDQYKEESIKKIVDTYNNASNEICK